MPYEIGHLSNIADQPEATAVPAPEDKAERLHGVVRNGKAGDLDFADGEPVPVFKELPADFAANRVLENGTGADLAINRHLPFPEQDIQTAGMITVLVGKDDAGQTVPDQPPVASSRRTQLLGAQTGIDQGWKCFRSGPRRCCPRCHCLRS